MTTMTGPLVIGAGLPHAGLSDVLTIVPLNVWASSENTDVPRAPHSPRSARTDDAGERSAALACDASKSGAAVQPPSEDICWIAFSRGNSLVD